MERNREGKQNKMGRERARDRDNTSREGEKGRERQERASGSECRGGGKREREREKGRDGEGQTTSRDRQGWRDKTERDGGREREGKYRERGIADGVVDGCTYHTGGVACGPCPFIRSMRLFLLHILVLLVQSHVTQLRELLRLSARLKT